MYRFRKKSDTQRPRPPPVPPANSLPAIDAILPPPSDFRTSLILPSLTRRFTLLRTENGDRIRLQNIKDRLVQRRAQAVDQLTEEEEDLVLEMLGNARMEENQTVLTPSPESAFSTSMSHMEDMQPLSPAFSVGSEKSSHRSNNRRSNNLFGSHVDYPLPSRRSRPSTVTTQGSVGGSDSQEHRDEPSQFTGSSPYEDAHPIQDASITRGETKAGQSTQSTLLLRSPEFLSAATAGRMNRVSRALEQVLDDIESEAVSFNVASASMERLSPTVQDPTIHVPGRTILSGGNIPSSGGAPMSNIVLNDNVKATAQTPWTSGAFSSSHHREYELPRTDSVSPPPVAGDPARRIPGYIPGMHRPITPRREIDAKDQERMPSVDTRSPASSPVPSSHSYFQGQLLPSSHSITNRVDTTFSDRPSQTSHFVDTKIPDSHLEIPLDASRDTYPSEFGATRRDLSMSDNKIGGAPSIGDPNSSYGLPTSPVRRRHQASVSPSPKLTSRRPSLSTAEEPSSSSRMLVLSEAWSSGDEIQRSSRREDISRTPPLSVSALRTPPPERKHASTDADSSGRWIHSTSSSISSRANRGRLDLSSRFSTSSSSLSLGSSYHSSTDNLLATRLERSTFANAFQSEPLSRWDGMMAEKLAVHSGDTGEPLHTSFDYENALNTLGISRQEVHAIQARLLQTLESNLPNNVTSNGAIDHRRQRRSSTPYSVQSGFSGEDTEAGMATESTVTPKRAQPLPNALSPAPVFPHPVALSSHASPKLSKADMLLASMLESLSATQNISPAFDLTAPSAVAEYAADKVPVLKSAVSISPHTNEITTPSKESVELGKLPNHSSIPFRSTPADIGDHTLFVPLQNRMRPDDPELLKDVERQTTAATAFLKNSPSLPKVADKGSGGRRSLKRINPQHIGSPQLLSSSITSEVSGLPLSPSLTSIPQVDKPIGLLRRLRNSVKAKPLIHSDTAHFSAGPTTAPPALPSSLHLQTLSNPQYVTASDKDDWRDISGVSSPPAGQVGLKGFMTRLRRSKRETDSSLPSAIPTTTIGSPSSTSFSLQQKQATSSIVDISSRNSKSVQGDNSALHLTTSHLGVLSSTQHTDAAQPTPIVIHQQEAQRGSSSALPATSQGHASLIAQRTNYQEPGKASAALRMQIQGPLSSLLTRHPSARNPGPPVQSGSVHAHLDVSTPYHLDVRNPIVRRTLIFAESGVLSAEHIAAVRKSFAGHSRIGSASSNLSLSRSIRDRVPTPPPTRLSTRKAAGASTPPLPSLLSSMPLVDSALSPVKPAEPGSKDVNVSDEYARSIRSLGPSIPGCPETSIPRDAGIELLELSNGQVIWSVVDGLRAGIADENDEDDKSSFTSDFSTGSPSRDETVQLFVRGHKRNESSKGSEAALPKKAAIQFGRARPETKVYFSSSAQISSLIENISRGLESGSFNIVPSDPTSPFSGGQWNPPLANSGKSSGKGVTVTESSSHRDTDPAPVGRPNQVSHQAKPSIASSEPKHWTMEEQLERTWNAVNPNS
ncbi:hypothetical protein DACRYDRAFT_103837 [Dacryopinax primogenitus]|uniref:Uncharacterized protein n=1 Tax=Dacryopinax primogenitus (strain DJM 731) TaxID=1858805 RepID=M5GGE5_DACPD|nr:uncharacterized protein DACRYDRAFT_103837 [Dacryopinax primogenitus]EJU05348.1 hypothetical protein DACRYDRAFT_103837 [Dacryopinax primogenitus]